MNNNHLKMSHLSEDHDIQEKIIMRKIKCNSELKEPREKEIPSCLHFDVLRMTDSTLHIWGTIYRSRGEEEQLKWAFKHLSCTSAGPDLDNADAVGKVALCLCRSGLNSCLSRLPRNTARNISTKELFPVAPGNGMPLPLLLLCF